MDLSTLKKRLNDGVYLVHFLSFDINQEISSPEEFLADMNQIFTNAMTYNMKSSEIWADAKKLKQLTKKEMQGIASTKKVSKSSKKKGKKGSSDEEQEESMEEDSPKDKKKEKKKRGRGREQLYIMLFYPSVEAFIHTGQPIQCHQLS